MGKTNVKALELVRDFNRRARKKYRLKKVILFGSQVGRTLREGSDIDVLVVTDKFANRSSFIADLLAEWHLTQKKREPVDFLPFTESEFEEASKKITIVRQALQEGVLV